MNEPLRIRYVTPVVCHAHMRNWVFVKVETDEGITGWGEATLEWKTRAVVGCIEDLAPLVLGLDPRDIENAVQVMARHGFWRMGVIGMSAISGIEVALWDILGQSLGVPVWRLLGGACRDSLRTYTHLGMGDMASVYESTAQGPLVERALRVVEAGYDALKVVPVPYTHYLAPNREVDALAASMLALREAVGPSVDLMVDLHGRPASVAAARDHIAACAPARPMFVEEPVPPEDLAGMAHLTATSPMTIAGGERLVGRREFAQAVGARAFHVAQPDIAHVGGLWEARKVAAMCETAGIGVAPHNPLGPIAGVAALHFGIATPNVIIQEEMSGAVPWYGEVVRWPIERRPGRWDRPERPGLGIVVNEGAIARHPFEPEVQHARGAVLPDGTAVDW